MTYWFFSLLGYFWLILGIFTILFTKTVKRYYRIFVIGNHPKSMGALAIFVGSLLISSSANCNYYILILILGIIQIIKGIYLMFAPEKYIQELIKWWLSASLLIYRLWGFVTLAMGFILIKARL